MKILIVLEATLGGTSRHILDLANGLLARGEGVHLVYSTLRADRRFTTGLASLCKAHPQFRCYSIPMTREVTVSDVGAYRATFDGTVPSMSFTATRLKLASSRVSC